MSDTTDGDDRISAVIGLELMVALAGLALAVGVGVLSERKVIAAVELIAKALGLELDPLAPRIAFGALQGATVELFHGATRPRSARQALGVGVESSSTWLSLRVARSGIPKDLHLSLSKGALEVHPGATSPEALAVLAGPLRERIAALVQARALVLKEGALHVSILVGLPPFARELSALVLELVELSRALCAPPSPELEARLARALLEAKGEARADHLSALIERAPAHEAARQLLEQSFRPNPLITLEQLIEGLRAMRSQQRRDCAAQLLDPGKARRAVYTALQERTRALSAPDVAVRALLYALAVRGDELTLERLALLFPVAFVGSWEPLIVRAEGMVRARLLEHSGGLSLVEPALEGALSPKGGEEGALGLKGSPER